MKGQKRYPASRSDPKLLEIACQQICINSRGYLDLLTICTSSRMRGQPDPLMRPMTTKYSNVFTPDPRVWSRMNFTTIFFLLM